MFKGKKIAVLGGEGMIGKELVKQLQLIGGNVFSYDIKNGYDLSCYSACYQIFKDTDFVFSLVGVKGSPRMTNAKPLDFMFPMLRCETNIIKAAIDCKVEKFLYTSSIAVLNPKTDRFPAWAKMTGELLLEAARIQYPDFKFVITRPANVYGKYHNFDNMNAMVVTSLVRKAILCNAIEVRGDGSEMREFISAKDVAKGMILTMLKSPEKPVNLGSGETHSIKELAEILSKISNKPIVYKLLEKEGDRERVVFKDENRADIGFKAEDNFKESIIEVYNYARNKCVE